jgi:3-methylcrotonyl-CoA carboxylase alpha subunit
MEIRLRHGARALAVTIADGAEGLHADVDGRPHALRRVAAHRRRTADGAEATELLAIDGRMRRAIVVRSGDRLLVSLDGRAHGFALGEEPRRGGAGTGVGAIVAPMPGKIVRVLVSPGDTVEAGQPLVVLEAMKMETTLRAEIGGRVAAVAVVADAMVRRARSSSRSRRRPEEISVRGPGLSSPPPPRPAFGPCPFPVVA